MTRAGLGMLVAAAVVSLPAPARAATPAFLVLDLDGCAAAPSSEIRNIVEVELRRSVALLDGPKGETPETGGGPGVTKARLTCDDLVAMIDIADPVTGKTLRRAVDLEPVPPLARTHLIALSIVELLLASWSELLTDTKTAARPVGTPAAPETRAAALELVRGRAGHDVRPWMSLRLLATGAFSSFTAGKSLGADPWLYGGGLLVGGDGPRHLGWIADLSFQHGDRTLSLGQISADSLTGLAAAVGHLSLGRFVLRGGLGARGGMVWMGGTPVDPENTFGGAVRGAWWGPAALLDGNVRIGRRAVVAIGVEMGRTMLPVTALVQGDSPVVIGGTWLRASVGVGLAQ